ncbi:MAG: hypothetical protein GQ565_10485 [Candidatus Aegiribacteria sp.]|nr:hypothetical protein [Candidatus Aegiribacteria sp.]
MLEKGEKWVDGRTVHDTVEIAMKKALGRGWKNDDDEEKAVNSLDKTPVGKRP